MHPLISMMIAGILPFGAVFIELFFILNVSVGVALCAAVRSAGLHCTCRLQSDTAVCFTPHRCLVTRQAIWENQFYYLFGFLFLVFVILALSCGEIAIVMTYLQLCSEDYHWWWRSFLVSGGCAIYVFLYSVFYFMTKLEVDDFVSTLIFFGYTLCMVFGFWIMTGTIGLHATYKFNCVIYGSIKID